MGDNNISAIKLGRKYYYQYADLVEKYPYIFRGCKTTKNFINKYDIDEKCYTFAREKDDNEWIQTSGTSRKYDKMFISRKWFDDTFDEEDLVDPDITPGAPDIIELDDSEKFFDNKGNIVEIEVRGEREFNKCYFKVKDIVDGFDMKSLHKVLINKGKKGYELGKHYIYLCTSNGVKQETKKLYLTFMGFHRTINNFTFDSETMKNIYIWLTMFISRDGISRFTINIVVNDLIINFGYVYCITSSIVNAIKIGYWTGTYEGLRSRYITVYGKNLEIHAFETKGPFQLEQQCHSHFNKYRITNELFEKAHLKKYITYIKQNIDI